MDLDRRQHAAFVQIVSQERHWMLSDGDVHRFKISLHRLPFGHPIYEFWIFDLGSRIWRLCIVHRELRIEQFALGLNSKFRVPKRLAAMHLLIEIQRPSERKRADLFLINDRNAADKIVDGYKQILDFRFWILDF